MRDYNRLQEVASKNVVSWRTTLYVNGEPISFKTAKIKSFGTLGGVYQDKITITGNMKDVRSIWGNLPPTMGLEISIELNLFDSEANTFIPLSTYRKFSLQEFKINENTDSFEIIGVTQMETLKKFVSRSDIEYLKTEPNMFGVLTVISQVLNYNSVGDIEAYLPDGDTNENFGFKTLDIDYIHNKTTYLDLLNYICQISGAISYISSELGMLVFDASTDDTATSQINVDLSYGSVLKNHKITRSYEPRPYDTVIFTKPPAEDSLFASVVDEENLRIKSFTLENNLLVELERGNWADQTLQYYRTRNYGKGEFTTKGMGLFMYAHPVFFFEGTRYMYTEMETTLGMALKEVIKCDKMEGNAIDYSVATNQTKIDLQTRLIVDKQQGIIDALIQQNDGLMEQVANLRLEIDNLSVSFSERGGMNLIKNSVGKNGGVNWEGGTPNVLTTIDIQDHTISNSAFHVVDTFIVQYIPVIIGNTYSLTCKYKAGVGYNSIAIDQASSGQYTFLLNETRTTLGEWTEASISFVARSKFISVILNTSTPNPSFPATGVIVSDLIMVEGATPSKWTQHPDEVYVGTTRIDGQGVIVENNSSSTTARITTSDFAIVDKVSGRKTISVNQDESIFQRTLIQDNLLIYDDDLSTNDRTRFQPHKDGLYVVIEDR